MSLRQFWDARDNCLLLGGDLVLLQNVSADNAVQSFADAQFLESENANNIAWIGITDAFDEGAHFYNFSWLDGVPAIYTRWAPGQPDNSDQSYDCELDRPCLFPPSEHTVVTYQDPQGKVARDCKPRP